jgi:methionyl-tRNA formyltransferase
MLKIVLFGGTDLTLAVAKRLVDKGVSPVLCVGVEKTFRISYNLNSKNIRHASLRGFCELNGIKFIEFKDFKSIADQIKQLAPDIGFVVGWYHMVPSYIREIFPYGALGIHASLLPELRGGAPLNWSIILGKKETGVSLFALTDGVDDGPLYGQKAFSLDSETTITDLVKRCEVASLELIDEFLEKIRTNSLLPRGQEGEISYCLQRIPEDSQILWSKFSSEEICRLVRASTRPYSGAFTFHQEELIRIWRGRKVENLTVFGRPGQIFCHEGRVFVVCKQGIVEIIEAGFKEDENAMPLLLKSSHQRFQEQP